MKKSLFQIVLASFLLVSVLGCAKFGSFGSVDDYTRYDEVLVYDRPYDYTFLRTLEALTSIPTWVLETTDKEKGLIVFRNTEYGHIWDRDKQTATFLVTRVSRTQTSVELDEDSQRVREGGKFLKRIDHFIAHDTLARGQRLGQTAGS